MIHDFIGGKENNLQHCYEVTVSLSPEIAGLFLDFLRNKHIEDILKTGCFTGAKLETEADAERRIRVRYLAADRESIDRYFEEHADRLRSAALERFPTGITIERAIWAEIAKFTNDPG